MTEHEKMEGAGGNKVARPQAMLVLLTMAYCLAYVDRLMMAVVAEQVKAEFGLSDKQLFLLTGAAFVLIYGACGIFSGWLLDRSSRRKIVAGSLWLWSIFTMACAMAGNFWHLAIARAGVGAGESAIVPAALSLISDSYPPRRRPLAMGIFYAGGMVGILIAWVVGGWIAHGMGWRWAFLLAGPPGILLGLVIWFRGGEMPRAAVAPASASPNSTFHDVWRNRPLMWLITAGSVITFVNIGLINLMGSFFIRSHGMTVRDVGLVFGPVMAAGMVLGLIGGGWIGNRLANRGTAILIRFSMWNCLAMFPLYMGIFLAEELWLALLFTFLGTISSVLYSPSFSAAYQAVSAAHTRGTAAGISNFASALIGGALATFLVGALSDHLRPEHGADSLRLAMMAGMVTCLIAAALFHIACRKVMRERPELLHG
ncbi:MFS transporter [Sandaracinobacter sp. RS1-74]|uniref:spinster family MFS transporter n=1 Tax=Sandaracinobacteroides sayramensis TaxID=2913411 RepID=UPI001EDA276E|nr:MFS transporter [Sandaracinobacteroides sayramensis]MCG2840900.1 MFS transporter [Sandaracinobacteroides sayramensis]